MIVKALKYFEIKSETIKTAGKPFKPFSKIVECTEQTL